jgi:glycosyltransferase involved in cell wall biosynthesis
MGDRIKTLLIETGGWGGIAHYTYNLSQELSKIMDLEVILLTDRDYELDGFPRNFRIVKIPIKNQTYFRAVFRIINFIIKIKPDIIHIQSLISARRDWIFFVLARLLMVNVIFTAHNVLPHDESEKTVQGMRFAFKSIYAFCKALITHSEENKKELIGDFNVKASKIFVIPHGNYLFHTDGYAELTKNLAREKLGLSSESKVVLCFGAIREYKGLQYLIPAFKDVVDKLEEARLIIVGPSKQQNLIIRYKELIKELDLEQVIKFIPRYIPLNEIGIYFKASDLVVFPYLHTYGSGALHTAFAFSKPVIVSDIAVFREMVKEGQNGYIIPPQDIQVLAEKITRCLSMRSDKLAKIGSKSLRFAKSKYNWIDIAKSTMHIYQGIVGYSRKKLLIVAPDFGPPYNERWKNTVKAHSQILYAPVLGTSTMNRIIMKDGKFLIFNNHIVIRYTIFLIYLLFIQGKYDYLIFEGDVRSRFNQVIYALLRKGLLNSKKSVGVSYVTQKWIIPDDKQVMTFIKNVLPKLRYFLVNDEEEEQALVKLTQSLNNFIVVRPGIDLERYSYIEDPKCKAKGFSFLFASAPQGKWGWKNKFHNKGLYIFLSAFKRFINDYPSNLYLIWRSVFYGEIKSLIRELNIENNVKVVDGQIDILPYYRRCSVTVFPIRDLTGSPHYPMSIMESLACGRPVIVSNKVKISKIIKEENCGEVIEPNKEDLYRAMVHIFNNYDELHGNCRKVAEKYFDFRKNLGVFVRRLGEDR